MKIIRQPDGTLLVKSSSLWIAGLCAAAAVLLYWAGFALARGGTLVAATLFLFLGVAWLRESSWVFDTARGTVRWSRMRFFVISAGEFPLNEISAVRIESATGSRAGALTYRLVLNTLRGDMPLSDTFSAGQAKHAELRETIERFLETQQVSSTAAKEELHAGQ